MAAVATGATTPTISSNKTTLTSTRNENKEYDREGEKDRTNGEDVPKKEEAPPEPPKPTLDEYY